MQKSDYYKPKESEVREKALLASLYLNKPAY